MTHNVNLNLHNHKEKSKYYSNTNQVWNTNECDLTPTQNTKKVDQRKNNHEKTKVTKNHENTCLNTTRKQRNSDGHSEGK